MTSPPLTPENALQYVMENNDLSNLLSEVAAKAFREAEALRAIDHHHTAAQLDRLAETLGDIQIPEVKIAR